MPTKTKSKDREGRDQIPVVLPKPCSVDAAATWDEGYGFLPGEVWTVSEEETRHNPYSDVRLNVQKSAEAIVPGRGMSLEDGSTNGGEGPHNRSLTSERRVEPKVRKQCKERRRQENPATVRRIGWSPKGRTERIVL